MGEAAADARCAAGPADLRDPHRYARARTRSHDNESACGISAQERRAVQRQGVTQRVLRLPQGAERRRVVHGHDRRARSDVFERPVHHELGFQEGARRLEISADTVYGTLMRQDSMKHTPWLLAALLLIVPLPAAA